VFERVYQLSPQEHGIVQDCQGFKRRRMGVLNRRQSLLAKSNRGIRSHKDEGDRRRVMFSISPSNGTL